MKRTPEDFFEGEFKRILQTKFGGGKPGKFWLYVVIAVVIVWILSGIYIVSPGEMAVVRRFGKMTKTATSGPHWHIPRPIEKVNVVKVEEIRSMELGFRTISSAGASRIRSYPVESLMITGDENLVKIMVVIQYRISDLPNYLFKVWDPEGQVDRRTLRDAAETALRGVAGSMKIDDILTTGRAKVQDDTRTHLQELMDLYETGLMITAVKLQAVDPPEQVQAAFKDVVSAKEDRERIINEAQAYKEDLLPKARGEAEQKVRNAEAYKESRIRQAKGDAARFESMLTEYRLAKNITRERLYLETVQEMLTKVNKIVVSKEVAGKTLPLLPLGELSNPLPLTQNTGGDEQ